MPLGCWFLLVANPGGEESQGICRAGAISGPFLCAFACCDFSPQSDAPTHPLNAPISCCRYTVLFSHGNAVDLGQMSSFYIGLGTRINCNIFSYDYSGYGASTGKPSERNLYSDIDAAWQALRTR